MKHYINAVIFGIAIVIASYFLGEAYKNRTQVDGEIRVTGLGKVNFISDLIVWEGSFSVTNYELKNAYTSLEKDKITIKKYLVSKGIKESKIVFQAVNPQKQTQTLYSSDGKYMGEKFVGYRLTQRIKIESKEVDKVEKISREISELLNQGIDFYSEQPRYYYTKLSDLKIEMISKATEDAKLRAEKIAQFSGSQLGSVKSAKMGVFQITGQNSKEDYSWGGTFNTSSKAKTASITVKLVYQID